MLFTPLKREGIFYGEKTCISSLMVRDISALFLIIVFFKLLSFFFSTRHRPLAKTRKTGFFLKVWSRKAESRFFVSVFFVLFFKRVPSFKQFFGLNIRKYFLYFLNLVEIDKMGLESTGVFQSGCGQRRNWRRIR